MTSAYHNAPRMADSRALVPFSPGESSMLPAIESAKPTTLALKASAATQSMAVSSMDVTKSVEKKKDMKGTRGYNELMDEFSLHTLIFRKGKLLDETPEFVSFRRLFIDKWGPVSFIIMSFENLFKKFDVQHA